MLTPAEVEQLGTPGSFMRQGFLGPRLATAAARSAQELVDQGRLARAGIGRGHLFDSAVRGDSTLWLEHSRESPFAAVLERFDELRQALNEHAWLGLRRAEVQLAHYPGTGARYERHRDAFPGDDNRRVTAIVYLNADWQPAHGGRLALHLDPPRVIEPRLDTLVVFRSQLVEHEVEPAHADRLAITAWYSAR